MNSTSDKLNTEQKIKFTEKLNDFISTHRMHFFILSIVILIVIIGVGVFSFFNNRALINSTSELEKLEALYQSSANAEANVKNEKLTEIITQSDLVIKNYGKQYAAVRAAFIKAEAFNDNGNMKEAENSFKFVAEKYPNSNLAPIALANAAVMAENNGDLDAAISYLISMTEKYPTRINADKTRFSIARLYESTNKNDKAIEEYSKMLAGGNNNDWTKLAHSRLMVLKTTGKN